MIATRHAKANNHLMDKEDYDPTKPECYIVYLDANNLYGWSMSQKLPYSHFRFFEDDEVKHFNSLNKEEFIKFLKNLDVKNEGCYFEVKLNYPEELYDKHNCTHLHQRNAQLVKKKCPTSQRDLTKN